MFLILAVVYNKRALMGWEIKIRYMNEVGLICKEFKKKRLLLNECFAGDGEDSS